MFWEFSRLRLYILAIPGPISGVLVQRVFQGSEISLMPLV
jgi:hypothetical protein